MNKKALKKAVKLDPTTRELAENFTIENNAKDQKKNDIPTI